MITLPDGHRAEYTHLRKIAVVDSTGIPREIEGHWNKEYAYDAYGEDGVVIQPRGGATFVQVIDAGDEVVAEAWAECSFEDNFVKATGRAIALGRALAELSGEKARRLAKRENGGTV